MNFDKETPMGAPNYDEDDIDEITQQKKDFHDYTTKIKLKEGHEKCPIWIAEDYRIFLEAFSPLYREVTDFLIAIAEPVSRPTYIHEYVLTRYSLYAAVSVGLTKHDIFTVLRRFAKNEDIPDDVKSFIEQFSTQYGKAKLVLKENRYFIESVDERTKGKLFEISAVKQAN